MVKFKSFADSDVREWSKMGKNCISDFVVAFCVYVSFPIL